MSVNYIATVIGVAWVACVCVCARVSSAECVAVFSETPVWAYDRTVWLRFTTLLGSVWTHTHSHKQTYVSAFCLRLWLFVVHAPGVKLLSVWLCPSVASRWGGSSLATPLMWGPASTPAQLFHWQRRKLWLIIILIILITTIITESLC